MERMVLTVYISLACLYQVLKKKKHKTPIHLREVVLNVTKTDATCARIILSSPDISVALKQENPIQLDRF